MFGAGGGGGGEGMMTFALVGLTASLMHLIMFVSAFDEGWPHVMPSGHGLGLDEEEKLMLLPVDLVQEEERAH